jgi:hypothetical protein
MSLLARLRKRQSEACATATVATLATKEVEKRCSVACVATVTVAKFPEAQNEPVIPMTCDEEQSVRSWLAQVGENDPVIISDLLIQCQTDIVARQYVIKLESNYKASYSWNDDRRTCQQCVNLIGENCAAAFRGELRTGRNYEPVKDILRRCEGYDPQMDDADRRLGKERWSGLVAK